MAERPNEWRPDDVGMDESMPVGEVDAVIIRAEIEDTRAQLGDTIDQIGERLSPSHIKQQIGQSVHDATVGRVEDAARAVGNRVSGASKTFVDVLRENPIPVAMVGMGLGWLYWSARNRSSGSTSEPITDRVADRARSVATTVESGARETAQIASDQFFGNPLAIGIVAVAAGLAAGLAIPESPKERELMGAARDTLVDRAKDMASETKEKLQHVAERTLDQAKTAATEAAKDEGLTRSA